MGIAEARRKKARQQAKPTPPQGDVQTLYCEDGQHEWSRPPQRGKKPRNCPDHRTAVAVATRRSSNPFAKKQNRSAAVSTNNQPPKLRGLGALRARRKPSMLAQLRLKREEEAQQEEIKQYLEIYARAHAAYDECFKQINEIDKRCNKTKFPDLKRRAMVKLNSLWNKQDTLQNTMLSISSKLFRLRGYGVLATEVDELLASSNGSKSTNPFSTRK